MKLTGSYKINLEKQKVWEALNDPEILKQAIPGCEEFNKKSETEFSAKATNKIGPFNATFSGDIELKDLNPPNSYKILGSGNSLVGFASGEAEVKLEDTENGTNLIFRTIILILYMHLYFFFLCANVLLGSAKVSAIKITRRNKFFTNSF